MSKVILTGAEAARYLQMLTQDRRLLAIEEQLARLVHTQARVVDTMGTISTHLLTMEQMMAKSAQQILDELNQLATDVAGARDTVVATVTAESAEDQEQNARLAEKQASLDAAEVEIARLRSELVDAGTPEAREAISAKIAELSETVRGIKAASVVTDPNAPIGLRDDAERSLRAAN